MSEDIGKNEQPLIGVEGGTFSGREKQTLDELRTLDAQLAGLYEQGLRLLSRIHESGSAYLVAHAGRELSRGLIQRLLSQEEIYIPADQIDDQEKNRATIAGILQLPTADPRVDIWFQLTRDFAAWSHFSESGPPSEGVRSAFEQLSSLLFGRIGPYFATQGELDALLQITSPTADDVKTLQTYLLRPAQRQYFFARLQSPLWAKLLDDAEVFSNPPDRIRTADPDKFVYRSWPEGIYLSRIAPYETSLARAVFERIPKDLKNPLVWNALAEAVLQMDPDSASSFVNKLKEALESGSTDFFVQKIVKVTGTLALGGKPEAFELADHLMWVPPSNDEHNKRIAVYNTEWMFPRFAHLGLGIFFKEVLPALEGIDPEKTMKLLLSKMNRINAFSEPDGYGLGIWRRADDSNSTRENIPAKLFRAVTEISVRLVQTGTEAASGVMRALEHRSDKIYTKLRYGILAKAGDELTEELDEIITSGDALNPPYFLREIPELIRNQFRNASPLARRIFQYGLERGPDMPQLRSYLPEDIEELSESHIIEARISWLRRRLTWFRGEIPDELRALAKQAGMDASIPSFEEQELAEVGHYSGGVVSWIDEPAVETEDLSTRSIEEIFAFMKSWAPPQDEESRVIGQKLEGSLLEFCSNFPDKSLEIARMIMKQQVAPRFVNSFLTGFQQAATANKKIDWNEVLQFGHWAIQLACEHVNGSPEEHPNWSELASSAVTLARTGADEDRAPQTASSSMWGIMHAASDCGLLWQDSSEEPFRNFEEVLTEALNTRSGEFVRALISVSLWTHRSGAKRRSEEDEELADDQTLGPRQLTLILDRILEKRGRSGIAAQAMLGQFIPQVHLLAPRWVITNSEVLFRGGAEDPLSRPIWAAYITRAPTYTNVFEALRPWYLIAAQVAGTPAGRIKEEEREWSITRNLTVKVTVEMIRGTVTITDPDNLLATVFTNVPVVDKSQAYWSIFSWWRESSEPLPASFVDRLVTLWQWRLNEIAKQPDHADTIAEASGLSWLFRTRYVPDEALIRFGLPTIKLARGDIETYGAWEKLLELSEINPDETFGALETIVQHELKAEYAHIPVGDVVPILRTVLLAGNAETKRQATQLINRLGEKGYGQFGELLK